MPIADPGFATKAANHHYSDIRKCIACRACISLIYHDSPTRCTVNAAMGQDAEYRIRPAKKRKVLVIGGGTGGMEAARVAALRGHEVSLYEKKYALGGNLVAASAVSFKKEMKEFLFYLSDQMIKCGVNLHLATAVDNELIKSVGPDVAMEFGACLVLALSLSNGLGFWDWVFHPMRRWCPGRARVRLSWVLPA